MIRPRPQLYFALDEGVPNSVGSVLERAGHTVIYLNRGEHVLRGSTDQHIASFALLNDLILVAIDGDMRAIASGHGATAGRYAALNLLKLSCDPLAAARRVEIALSLIEHEWLAGEGLGARRLFVEIKDSVIRTNR